MRTGALTVTALLTLCVALPALAADPLAALDGDKIMDSRSNGKRLREKLDPLSAMVPVKPQVTVTLPAAAAETLPPSFNTGGGLTPISPVPSTRPVPGSGVWAGPTAPTPPTLPSVIGPTGPLWKFGD
ncbi:MAG: hypothetical protein H7Y60_01450 [Rhodospirillaceae bacterium]|nr:hypothetical protein [Rhodospirillales bacterium]